MSILSGKNILVVGAENPQIIELESVFKKHKLNVFTASCNSTTTGDIEKLSIDIILLNHLHDDDICSQILDTIRGTRFAKEIPVFALVPDSEQKIQQALMMGAADYITTNEPLNSIVQKMKVMLGESDNFSGATILDVPSDTIKVSGAGKKVFVIEDDALLRSLLASKLEASGFPAEFATNGAGIIEKVKVFKPNAIILDLMLPVKNGFEILAELKADLELKNIPVIVFSNRDSQEDKQKTFSLGAERFFVKAMTDLSFLIETIEELSV